MTSLFPFPTVDPATPHSRLEATFGHVAGKFLSQEHIDYGGLFNSEPRGFGLSGLLLWLWVVAIEEGGLFGILVFQRCRHIVAVCCAWLHQKSVTACHNV